LAYGTGVSFPFSSPVTKILTFWAKTTFTIKRKVNNKQNFIYDIVFKKTGERKCFFPGLL
jgi:hypothetical protein